MDKMLITGSEGLIGKKLVKYYSDKYQILKLDLALGHDLTNEEFVSEWFNNNRDISSIILLHAYNPVPSKDSVVVEPIDVPTSEIQNYLNINLLSVFNCCRYFIKHNKSGNIINISSLYGIKSPKHHIYNNFVKPIGYSLSKSSIISLSKYLSSYYAPDFRINTIIFGGLEDEKQDANFVKKYSENVPMKRLMKSEEIFSVFDFLLDGKNTYTTGTEIIVDGGWTSW